MLRHTHILFVITHTPQDTLSPIPYGALDTQSLEEAIQDITFSPGDMNLCQTTAGGGIIRKKTVTIVGAGPERVTPPSPRPKPCHPSVVAKSLHLVKKTPMKVSHPTVKVSLSRGILRVRSVTRRLQSISALSHQSWSEDGTAVFVFR